MPQRFHLAQANIARLLAPIDDPLLAGFVARLDDINALADAAPGFVWRLQIFLLGRERSCKHWFR